MLRSIRLDRLAWVLSLFVAGILTSASGQKASKDAIILATGKPAEGPLDAFLGKPFFDLQCVFEGQGQVREPYLAVGVDGSVLIVRNYVGHLRRSTDGGRTWSELINVPIRNLDSNIIVDEVSGDLLALRLWNGRDRIFRSRDGGRSWTEEQITVRLDAVEMWWQTNRLDFRPRSTYKQQMAGSYFLHANASEAGITLRHNKYRGRLIVTATYRPHALEHPSDRKPQDAIYSCAFYSDDRGKTWHISQLFPEGYTEEAGLVELSDGRLYFNSRSHFGFFDKTRARALRPEDWLRREAWSQDGGQTWQEFRVSSVLPDGGGFHRGYGMKGGLVRLPVRGRDILLYSNADTAGGAREKLTVWASFDGGKTWPIKRLVYDGPAAYSSLGAGRPQTPGEGTVFLLFEGGRNGPYSAMHLARFNLAWLLQGQRTGNGDVPDWLR